MRYLTDAISEHSRLIPYIYSYAADESQRFLVELSEQVVRVLDYNGNEQARFTNGDSQQLDTAQEQGQIVQNGAEAFASVAKDEDLEQFKTVDQECGPNQHPVFGFQIFRLISLAQQNRAGNHDHHQGSDKQQMLPG